MNEGAPLRIAFWGDERGAVVRDYVVAVVAGTAVAILVMTLLADQLYAAYVRTFRP